MNQTHSLIRFSLVLVASWLAVAALTGCEQQAKPIPRSTPLTKADSGSATTASDQISDEEAYEFGQRWETALSSGDVAGANRLMDWVGIFNRALDGLVDDEEFRQGFRKGAGGAVGQIVGQVTQATQASGTYELVDVVRRGGKAHVVFRLFTDDSTLNYHDIKLRRDGGRLVGDELFVATTGEAISDSLRNIVGPAVTSQTSLVGRMSGDAKQELDRLEAQVQVARAAQAGDNETTLRLYEALPPDLKKLKMPMLYRIMATPIEDEVAYDTALQEYLAEFPQDASVGLISIDAAVMRADPKMLQEAHASLTQWTGGDPLLDLMVAANLAVMGATDEGVAMAETVDMSQIKNASGHDFRLTLALEMDDLEETLKQLMTLRDQYGYEFQDLRDVEGFEEFAASEQFTTWLEN